MQCISPIEARRSYTQKPNGKYDIVFDITYDGVLLKLPCGQCRGCRLERSRQWAIRCMHEASMFKQNSFITLTYDDEHLPSHGTLIKKDFQLFMKRFRKSLGVKSLNPKTNRIKTYYDTEKRIRYYHCGEYGEKNKRPHYHAIIFNYQFDDLEYYTKINDVPLFTSAKLSNIWGKGFVTVGSVTFESAAYVARYILKKINGDQAKEHYQSVDIETGELHPIIPEYTTMSRANGIGHTYYKKYSESEIYEHDSVVVNGKEIKPPKYYDSLYEIDNPERYETIQLKREDNQLRKFQKETRSEDEIMRVKAHLLNSKLKQLPRNL